MTRQTIARQLGSIRFGLIIDILLLGLILSLTSMLGCDERSNGPSPSPDAAKAPGPDQEAPAGLEADESPSTGDPDTGDSPEMSGSTTVP